MEDFGDYIGQQGQQTTSMFLSQAMMELRMNRRYSSPIEEGVAEANADAENLRERIAAGDVGEVESNTFDLSSYDAQDRPVILKSLKDALSDNGFDPAGLVPVVPPDGADPVKWVYTFRKDEAERFADVINTYMELACVEGGLAGRAGAADRACYIVDGFGRLDARLRREFVDELCKRLDALGFDKGLVKLSRNADGTLAGDISVPVGYKGALSETCDVLSSSTGERFYVSYSLVPADEIESFDHAYSQARELSETLLRNGYDNKVAVTQSGSCLLSIDPDEAPSILDLVNRANDMKAESAFRKSGAGISADGPKPARSVISHAKEAAAAHKSLVEQGREAARELGQQVGRIVKPPLP